MSSTRYADAASLTPFPPGISPGRSASGAPESSDLSRHSRSRKGGAKPRPRAERSSRPDEERFNVGPISPRNTSAARTSTRRGARNSRQDRPGLSDLNDAVPNYPPPSFQEAISTPGLSICPSTLTLMSTIASPVGTFIPGTMPLPSMPPQSVASSQWLPQEVPNVNDSNTEPESNSDSDDSLLIIESGSVPPDPGLPSGTDLATRVREDWRHRRGVEFPSPTARTSDEAPTKPSTGLEARGRTQQRPTLDLAALLDGSGDPQTPVVASPKRRFLSLSPLRTIFPSKTPQTGDRPQTAHPTPGTSPYMQSPKGSTFFRSTTSLATASFLRLPLSSSTNGKSEKRRFFSSKKDKPKDLPMSPEALDSWEELSADDTDEAPSSLLSVVEACQCTSPASGISPTRSVSFTYGAPTVDRYQSLQASLAAQSQTQLLPQSPCQPSPPPPPPPAQRQPPAPQENPNNSVHPLSQRDRKVPFVQRHVRRSPAPTPPRIQVPIPVPLEPVLTTVRTRLPQNVPTSLSPPHQSIIPRNSVTAHVARPSPLSVDAFSPAEAELATLDSSFWKAVDTPLPSTPLKTILPLADSSTTSPPPSQQPQAPALAPAPARADKPLERGVSKRIRWTPPPLVEQPPVFSRAPSPFVEEPDTPTRHHYPGRPLPRPPSTQPRPHIDSTFAPNEEFFETPILSRLPTCKEGLLIDLDDGSTLDGNESDSDFAPFTDDLLDLSDTPASPIATAGILAPTPLCAPVGTLDFMPTLSSTPAPMARREGADHVEPAPGPVYSEITDLDLLASQLADDDERLRDGSNYDVSCPPAPPQPDLTQTLNPTPPNEGPAHASGVPRARGSPSPVPSLQHHLPSRISWRKPGTPDIIAKNTEYSARSYKFPSLVDEDAAGASDTTDSTIEGLPASRSLLESPHQFQPHRSWQWQYLPPRVY
ncbi:hypothetical protein DFP72DRAFT_1163303 [Ephemerocybe angulata]|uniref:Uncharacterized protein n=1 Tax=Ephemerocybe angulata TaxID=980116 RepID=A0A8H6MCL6_9AGAR|nr:hypothetical protein DFP72DRAFT_1163303 [Tulosesus angulatus]